MVGKCENPVKSNIFISKTYHVNRTVQLSSNYTKKKVKQLYKKTQALTYCIVVFSHTWEVVQDLIASVSLLNFLIITIYSLMKTHSLFQL